MEARLVRLYLRLLAWLPPGFRSEFAEEMGQVAAARMADAVPRRSGALLWLFLDELRALPGLWLYSCRRERQVFPMGTRSADTPVDGRESWIVVLVAAMPLVAFLCVYVMDGVVRSLMAAPGWAALIRLLWADALRGTAIPIVFYLVLLAGSLVAWLKAFPRWSYSYVGWLLLFLVAILASSGLDGSYVWRIWGPFLVTLLLAIALRPSLEPLRSLARGWKQDWTLSVLGVLGILQWLNGFGDMPGPTWAESVWLALCTAILVLGILAYMRLPSRSARVAALLGSAVLSLALGMGVRAYYWNRPGDSLVGWGAWLAVLTLPALLAAVLRRLRPGYRRVD